MSFDFQIVCNIITLFTVIGFGFYSINSFKKQDEEYNWLFEFNQYLKRNK